MNCWGFFIGPSCPWPNWVCASTVCFIDRILGHSDSHFNVTDSIWTNRKVCLATYQYIYVADLTILHVEVYDSELERMNVAMIADNHALQRDNKQLNALIKEYEQTLETVMSAFRNRAVCAFSTIRPAPRF